MRVLLGQIPGRPARPDRLPLEQLLPQVDALTLHCPLNEHTRNFIGARELALLKPGTFVVNTARGGLIDEQALAEALRSGHLGGRRYRRAQRGATDPRQPAAGRRYSAVDRHAT
nr:hypothetical protein GCM10020185_19270 [Pseudomonas brassicacearum subsp. brassicacearum]